MEDYKLVITEHSLKIYIKDTLHLFLKLNQLVGIQSWIEGNKDKKYIIEYCMNNTKPILSEYNKREKWEAILSLLDKEENLF